MIPFLDLRREWSFFETKFLSTFKKFGRAGIYVLGPDTEKFENNFSAYHHYKYGITISNGLNALEVALLAHNIKPGDEVITVANSAVATALAISNIGAKAVFCDIKDNYLMDEDKIETLINSRTKAILPVHLFGNICNMTKINKIARLHKLSVIEDACQAHGANFSGQELINTKVFSFYPTKNLGSLGEGGIIITNNKTIRDFAQSYRNYGQTNRYNHVIKGNNYRLSSLETVFLDLKLKKLSYFIKKRRDIAKKYYNQLKGLTNIIIPNFNVNSSYHLFVIRVLKKRNTLQKYLKSKGITTLIHYPKPIHRQTCYINEYKNITLSKTEKFQKEIISLPCYPFLKKIEQDAIIKTIKDFKS